MLMKIYFRMFKTTSTPFTVIVMEDLRQSDFCMQVCNIGLNLEDCERVLEKMAKFHAASVVYYEEVCLELLRTVRMELNSFLFIFQEWRLPR